MLESSVYTALAASLLVLTLLLLTRRPYRPFPLLGHAYAVVGRSQQDILRWMLAASRHFGGEPWRLEIPFVGKGWFVNDAATIKFVLNTAHLSFSKGRFFTERTKDLFGHGILLASGESWREQRRAGSVLVNSSRLDAFVNDILPGTLDVLLEPLTHAAKTNVIVDFCDVATDFSLAVFGKVAFQAGWTSMHNFSQTFIQASGRIANRFRFPFYRILEAVLPTGRKLRGELRMVHTHVRELVQRSKEEMVEEQLGGETGRGMLIRALMDTSLSETEVADSCLNFITAGVDTTAQALAWTVYLLAVHPRYITTLRQEITAAPRESPLLQAVISESLRLHPPIPLEIVENISAESIHLPSGKIVSPGEQIMWSSWVISRLPGPWGNDPERFFPERWIDMKHKPSAYEWPVFHAGPRSCLGQPLARLELTFALKELLERFDFEPAWDGEKEVDKGLTAPIKGGLPVRVRCRA